MASHIYKCHLCQKTFGSWNDLATHANSSVHKTKCRKCEKVFNTNAEMQKHLSSLSPGGCRGIRCYKCTLRFYGQRHLDQHIKEDHPPQFACEKCTLVFDSETERQIYQGKFHTFKCQKCDLLFRNEITLQEHHQQFHAFKCTKCPITFFAQDDFEKHWKLVHSFNCSNCTYIAKNFEDSIEHYHLKHGYTCEKCSAWFGTRNLLENHKNTVHKPLSPCTLCPGSSFKSPSDLEHHQNTVHFFQCRKCCDHFKDLESLLDHIEAAHQVVCKVCEGPCAESTIHDAYNEGAESTIQDPYNEIGSFLDQYED
jgi:hypothetical protein